MQLLIGGVNRNNLYQAGSLQIQDALNERTIASFALKDPAGAYRPPVGAMVQIYDNAGILIFAGTVDEPDEEQPLGTSLLAFEVPCVDWHQLADRHLVTETYANQTAGAIVNNLLTKYLAGEGVTAGTIQAGPTITSAVFPYVMVSQALQELSELTGYSWYIDANKTLHFFERSTNAAPWGIGTTSPIRKVKVRRTRAEYRNRQYVRAGQDISDARTENFKGDGAAKTFTVALPIALVPTVKVNGIAKTVGIQGVDTGKDWYWNKGEKQVVQDSAAVALAATDTLEVTYQGFFPIVAVSDDPAAIAERQGVEGGTGVYEAVDDAPNLDRLAAAVEKADGLLRRYARIGTTLEFETDRAGLKAGQILPVNLPEHALSGSFLIDRVTMTDYNQGAIRYVVHAVDGEAVGGWAQFFRRMVQTGRTFVIRENEILTRAVRLTDNLICSDSLTPSAAAPETLVGFASVGFSEVA